MDNIVFCKRTIYEMNKNRLKEIVFDQKEVFDQPKQLIDRDIDLDRNIDPISNEQSTMSKTLRIAASRKIGTRNDRLGLPVFRFALCNEMKHGFSVSPHQLFNFHCTSYINLQSK